MMALTSDMVDQLFVAPGWTGRGIGGRLIQLAKDRRPAGLDLYTSQGQYGRPTVLRAPRLRGDRAGRRFWQRGGAAGPALRLATAKPWPGPLLTVGEPRWHRQRYGSIVTWARFPRWVVPSHTGEK